jgi:predicted nucleic acid-binding protein
VAAYRDLPLGTVDASVLATGERLSLRDLATLDHRHFTVVKSALGAFRVVPDGDGRA